jgi:hypothetical protein
MYTYMTICAILENYQTDKVPTLLHVSVNHVSLYLTLSLYLLLETCQSKSLACLFVHPQ